MDRGAWRVIVRGVAKSQTQLKRLSTHMYIIQYNIAHNIIQYNIA